MEKKMKVILDVDTGTDDAVAIMAAVKHPDMELLAVCSVAGNKPVENTTENTLRVLQALGSDVPVYRGCAEPLVKSITPTRIPDHGGTMAVVDGKEYHVHPEYLDLPTSERSHEDMPAPMFYVDYLRHAKEPVTIIAVGPLTNLAVALLMDHDIVKNISRIVIMGGGFMCANRSPVAEFNIWADPDAAQWVIHCGADILMVPLDATVKTAFTKADAEDFRSLGTFCGDFCADLIDLRIDADRAINPECPDNNTAIHDALAVVAASDASVLRDVERVRCDIGLADFAEGATLITRSKEFLTSGFVKNVDFAFSADKEAYKSRLMELFS